MRKSAPRDTARWDTAVELKGVTKRFYQRQRGQGLKDFFHPEYRTITALGDVSFSLRKGEFVAYAGPNGAGKSTTFKLLCGLLAPEAGEVRSLGMDPMKERIPLMKRVGVLFGNRTELWWDHPVIASYEWKKVVWDIPEDEYKKRLDSAREMLAIDEFEKSFVRELSLGQRMRADLGLMLLHGPELVLLDEPTLGLDVLAKRSIIEYLKRINREENVTILVTSHDMDDLTEMAERLLLINRGEIAFDGASGELTKLTGDMRTLCVTAGENAPKIEGAKRTGSERNRHTYEFDANAISVSEMMRAVSSLPNVSDIETGRAPIEATIAGLYRTWQRDGGAKANI